MESRLRWLLPFVVLAAFLPYLSKGMGVRVENLTGLVLGVWAILLVGYRGQVSKPVAVLLLVSLAAFLHVTSATALGSGGIVNIKRGLGRLDHYSRPVFLIFICEAALFRATRPEIERTFVRCAKVFFACIVVNTVIEVMSIFMNIEPLVASFRPSTGTLGQTVAEAAAGNFRFVGIFNQPGEQGAAYAIALIIWVLLWNRRSLSTLQAAVTLLAILLGGALGISKVFLLGGVPVALILFLSFGVRVRDLRLGLIAAGLVTGVAVWIMTYWKGADMITGLFRLMSNPQTLLYALSGGRFGGEASLSKEYLFVELASSFQASPLFGVGAAGVQGFFDNEYLMAVGEGGLVGLFFVAARPAVVIVESLRGLLYDPYARALCAMGVLLAGASMGGPISGIPRCGSLFWLFTGLLLYLQPVRDAVPQESAYAINAPQPA